MKLSARDWENYVNKLSRINAAADEQMQTYIDARGMEDVASLVRYAYALATKYGEASGALACEMYDAIADASNVSVPPAEIAPTATYPETAKAVNGTIKNQFSSVSRTVGRLVKQVSSDTMLKNALRDGAKFAWIPHGDTCAFCITLASRGWQYMSKNALKNGHAEHIHANCDCEYAVSFDADPKVEGYDPEKYRQMYYGADGDTAKEKINSLRRMHYEQNKDLINAQKRVAYSKRIIIASKDSQFKEYLKLLSRGEGITLRKRQKELLEKIPQRNDWVELRNKQVNIKDLAALTAATGDEFALFSIEKRKILIHGGVKWKIPEDAWNVILSNHYTWEGHSHPTFSGKIIASREDIDTLKLFTWQQYSYIIDLNGVVEKFSASEQDWFNAILGIE